MKTVVVIPTYDEAGNAERMAGEVLAAVPDATVLFVDDNSPDGTGAKVAAMSRLDSRIKLLPRERKEGLAKAYVAGFKAAMEHGADRIVQMDCDFSHKPSDIPRLLSSGADLAIGSRYVKGGATPGWPLKRRFLSRAGGALIRFATGMRIKDPTGGFKAWKRATLEKIRFESIESAGYSFQLEMNWRTVRAGLSVEEIPIVFEDRAEGYSKISSAIAVESLAMCFKLARWRQCRRLKA